MNAPLATIAAAAPAVAMVASFACLIGGIHLLVKRKDRTKGALMVTMSLVLIANVLIWTL